MNGNHSAQELDRIKLKTYPMGMMLGCGGEL